MKYLIVANWKMNPDTLGEAKKLLNSVEKGIKNVKDMEVVICPPFVFIPSLKANGAQDCFWEEKGAFTGEISPKMLKNSEVKYVILGHSERRRYLRETDEMVNKKIKAVIVCGLKPILCIANLIQLRKSLKGISEKVIIAYEPVFAIGTGKSCSIGQAKKMRNKIKYPQVLYGGSVNSQNAGDYISQAGFQGLLIGGVSLNPQEFLKTIKNIEKT
ncbi:MAG: triose-phosphate isomerase [bacterium]